MDSTPRPEFSGGSAGVMGSAEAVGVFGRGATRYKSPLGPGGGERGEPGLVAKWSHPLRSIPSFLGSRYCRLSRDVVVSGHEYSSGN